MVLDVLEQSIKVVYWNRMNNRQFMMIIKLVFCLFFWNTKVDVLEVVVNVMA